MVVDPAKNRARLPRACCSAANTPRQVGPTPKLDLDFPKKSISFFFSFILFNSNFNYPEITWFNYVDCLDQSIKDIFDFFSKLEYFNR